MTFTDRHGRLIGDIEIPGVDSDETDDIQIQDADPVLIDDDIEIPGVDAVAGPENPTHKLLRLIMISTSPKPTHLQSR
jgi:hypothetical protein